MKQRILTIVLFVLFSGSAQLLKAQQITVNASIDSTNVLIGDQIRLNLEVVKPKDLRVQFPQVPDTFSSKIEVIRRGKVDTLKLDDKTRQKLVQQLVITSFDSGVHRIPPFYFRLKNGAVLDSVATRELAFQMHGMKIDTTKGPADIKVPYAAPVTLKEIIPYILGIILIAAIIFFIFYYMKWKKKRVATQAMPVKPADPAHIIALRELDRIKAQKLWQQEKIKQYYSEVSDTIRMYIQNRFNISALEQTSAETLGVFKSRRDLADSASVDQLQYILSMADLVKFAKYTPVPDENNQALMNAYFFVNQTKKEEIRMPEKPAEAKGEENVEKDVASEN